MKNNHIFLSREKVEWLQTEKYTVKNFLSGEIEIELPVTVRRCEVFIHCQHSSEIHSRLFEVLMLTNQCVEGGAKSVTLIAPYLAYSRCDKTSLRYLLNILYSAGVKRLITAEIHAIPAGSKVQIDSINIVEDLVQMINLPANPIIVSPDIGGIDRARRAANAIGVQFTYMEKKRLKNCIYHKLNDPSLVFGRYVLIVDDIIDSGQTITSAVRHLLENGAASVDVLAVHPVLSNPEITNDLRLINNFYITNSIHKKLPERFQVIDITSILSERIKERLYHF